MVQDTNVLGNDGLDNSLGIKTEIKIFTDTKHRQIIIDHYSVNNNNIQVNSDTN